MPTETTTAISTTMTELATTVAEFLLRLSQQQGSKASNDKDFQKLLKYKTIDQVEQDRCFNELVVTAIGYAYHRLDDELQPREMWEFAEMIRQAFPDSYKKQLLDMGVAEEFAAQWLELMDMRLKEYGQNLEEMGPQLRLDMAADDDDESSPEVKQLTIRMSLLVTAGLQHLRRGKLDIKDPLRKHLRTWLIDFEKEIGPLMDKMSAISKHEYEPEEH